MRKNDIRYITLPDGFTYVRGETMSFSDTQDVYTVKKYQHPTKTKLVNTDLLWVEKHNQIHIVESIDKIIHY